MVALLSINHAGPVLPRGDRLRPTSARNLSKILCSSAWDMGLYLPSAPLWLTSAEALLSPQPTLSVTILLAVRFCRRCLVLCKSIGFLTTDLPVSAPKSLIGGIGTGLRTIVRFRWTGLVFTGRDEGVLPCASRGCGCVACRNRRIFGLSKYHLNMGSARLLYSLLSRTVGRQQSRTKPDGVATGKGRGWLRGRDLARRAGTRRALRSPPGYHQRLNEREGTDVAAEEESRRLSETIASCCCCLIFSSSRPYLVVC